MGSKKRMSRNRCKWLCCTWGLTWYIPWFLLSWCGRMKTSQVRMAWREKLAICIIIFLLSGTLLFFLIAFGRFMCPRQLVYTAEEISGMTDIKEPHVYAYGRLYKIPDIIANHKSTYAVQEFRFSSFLGRDVSSMFFKQDQFDVYCPGLDMPDSDWDTLTRRQKNDATNYAHRNGQYLEILNKNAVGRVAWPLQYVQKQSSSETRLLIIGENVYDVSAYFNSKVKFLPPLIETLFSDYVGKDVTPQWIQFERIDPNAKQYLDCINHLFYIGIVDKRQTLQCQLSNYILLGFTLILVTIIVFKFLSALSCSSTVVPEQSEKYVIVQIPCYTENYESLANTLDAVAGLDYESQKYLMFIVVDGIVTGSGNDRPTHKILFEVLGIEDGSKVPHLYESLGEAQDQINRGMVYTGIFSKNGKCVPYLVVVKVGREDEVSKPGNRGKRDSQLILMRFLSRCYFDAPMSPMELEMKSQMLQVLDIDPIIYEYVLMVDSDTIVERTSLKHLVASFTHDSKMVGICGETLIANDKASWITMIQVYEYFISHHLSKSFESLFGSVTCLPGCFCMYRLRSANGKQPLLIAPKVLKDYSRKRIDTLHQKNLLSLGEDRYLTTLMMKHFPKYKLSFNANAKCRTVVPEEWSVLLSQRRRWINSTIHNLFELLTIQNLCGCCCFSMRFIVFIDLFSTLVQPAGLLYIGYLIYSMITQTEVFPLISIFMLAGAYGLQVLIFLFKREWAQIGWMIIYILAMPVFGFYIPIYSFWRMDDCTWGSTRRIEDEKDHSDDEFGIVLNNFKSKKGIRDLLDANADVVAIESPVSQKEPVYVENREDTKVEKLASRSSMKSDDEIEVAGPITTSSHSDDKKSDPVIQKVLNWKVQPASDSDPSDVTSNSLVSIPQNDKRMRFALPNEGLVQTKPKGPPSDGEIMLELRALLQSIDMSEHSKRSVRKLLEDRFKCELESKREFINNSIDKFLQK